MPQMFSRKKILIVDDDQPMIEIVKAVLKNEGAEPIGTVSPDKAIEIANSESIDAVILDRYMPERDGLDVLTQLKKTEKTKNIPVIMLTAEGQIEEIKKTVAMGADGYVVKPFVPEKIIKQLSKVLKTA